MFTAMQSDNDRVIICVKLTRHYGPYSIELGAEVDCEIGHEAARSRAFDEIMDTLVLEHRRAAERLRVQKLEQSGKPRSSELGLSEMEQPNGSPSAQTDTFEIVGISIDVVNGKRAYKVHGGRWKKFGVRAFIEDERVTNAVPPLGWDELKPGKHKVKGGLRALVSMAGDTPHKVLQILPADVEI